MNYGISTQDESGEETTTFYMYCIDGMLWKVKQFHFMSCDPTDDDLYISESLEDFEFPDTYIHDKLTKKEFYKLFLDHCGSMEA